MGLTLMAVSFGLKLRKGLGRIRLLQGTTWETQSIRKMETMEVLDGLVPGEDMIVPGEDMIVQEDDMIVLGEETVLDADMIAQEGIALEGTEVLGGTIILAIVELTKIIRAV
jgi:hypothetical protein